MCVKMFSGVIVTVAPSVVVPVLRSTTLSLCIGAELR